MSAHKNNAAMAVLDLLSAAGYALMAYRAVTEYHWIAAASLFGFLCAVNLIQCVVRIAED